MKKLSQMSFAQKLMFYLLVAFIPLFLGLFITFSLYSTNIIEKVSLYHTQTSVNDVIYALENRINEIENIPEILLNSINTTNIINPDNLLEKVFSLHPYIDECIIYLDSTEVKCHNHNYLCGAHMGEDSSFICFPLSPIFTDNSLLQYAKEDAHWVLSSTENNSPKILF
ncbi:MAG: hypothetical protein LIO65_04205, partial [Odoribacter sp.]|nr:hypothetical protein [Odoribacter sp.]